MTHYSQEDLVVIEFIDQGPSIKKRIKSEALAEDFWFFSFTKAEVCKFYYNQVFLTLMTFLVRH